MFLVEDLVKYSQINDNFTEQLSNDLKTKKFTKFIQIRKFELQIFNEDSLKRYNC